MIQNEDPLEAAGLPIAPSMEEAIASVERSPDENAISHRLLTIVCVAILIGIAAGVIAKALLSLIALISNLAFFGRFSLTLVPLTTEVVGLGVLVIPVIGALIIGVMARFGSPAIRGHGIPEVMEKVLYNRSRIPPRIMFLKPLSAAVAIGTGGPFGAEGPIIATGGAFGSFIGQVLRTTADERKTLLAAGAAAGMAATFGTPVSAVLLSIELLLFEYRARSIIPVALAASAATAVRLLIIETGVVFDMPPVAEPPWTALVFYVLLGALMGLASVAITKVVYGVEDGFERLPIHWMWWPAIGAVVVGVVGYFDPRVLGVGYVHIEGVLSGELLGWSLASLVILKFVAWAIYLGSGTSGGTLAPLFIIGGGLGALVGSAGAGLAPSFGISIPVAGLVGMAATFAGASHALLASIVFAFEATGQPLSLLPLLAGCSAAYMISILMMRTSIMTEKLARRGTAVRTDYGVDHLTQVTVRDVMSRDVVAFSASESVGSVRSRLASEGEGYSHQGFPVLDRDRRLLGVITRRDVHNRAHKEGDTIGSILTRPPVVIFEASSLRDAADLMIREEVGRIPVVGPERNRVVGIISRSDLLAGHADRLSAQQVRDPGLWGRKRGGK